MKVSPKKMFMARLCWFLAAVLLVLGGVDGAYAGYAGPKLRFRLAHPCPPGHHTSKAFEKFRDLVAEKSDHRIKVHIFPNAVLGSDVVMIKGAQSGGLEMAVSSSPNLTQFVPSLMVFDLPYITSMEHQTKLYAALDTGELGRFFRKEFNAVGLEPIMYCEYGYRNFVSVKKPLRSIEDLAGIKVRTTASPVEVEVAKALGMIPKPLAWGETYTALKEGIVEGEGNTFSFLLDAEHEDVLRYGILSHHNYGMQILSANLNWWKGLNPEARRIIREASAEALRYQREVLAGRSEEEALQRFEADGMAIMRPTPAEIEALKAKTRPVWERFRSRLGPGLIELVVRTQQ